MHTVSPWGTHILPLAQSFNVMNFNHFNLSRSLSSFLAINTTPTSVFEKQPLLSASSLSITCILLVQKCDFLNLTFLRLTLQECITVMRYSIETSNRLMVHLAWLINSCVALQKASGSIKEVVSPSSRPQITFEV